MIDWSLVREFKRTEAWGDPDRISPLLMAALVDLRRYVGKPFIVHCGTQGSHISDVHGKGLAVDFHCPDLDCFDLFLAASRFGEIKGLGVYPYWNNPGIHLDVRPEHMRAMWWRDRNGVYQQLTHNAVKGW